MTSRELLSGTARTMRRIEKITGRGGYMIILRGMNLFRTRIEELPLSTSAPSAEAVAEPAAGPLALEI